MCFLYRSTRRWLVVKVFIDVRVKPNQGVVDVVVVVVVSCLLIQPYL